MQNTEACTASRIEGWKRHRKSLPLPPHRRVCPVYRRMSLTAPRWRYLCPTLKVKEATGLHCGAATSTTPEGSTSNPKAIELCRFKVESSMSKATSHFEAKFGEQITPQGVRRKRRLNTVIRILVSADCLIVIANVNLNYPMHLISEYYTRSGIAILYIPQLRHVVVLAFSLNGAQLDSCSRHNPVRWDIFPAGLFSAFRSSLFLEYPTEIFIHVWVFQPYHIIEEFLLDRCS